MVPPHEGLVAQPPDPANDPRAFVQCLRKLGLTNHRLRQSILDFYRATVHRDRWVTDTLLNFEEIEDYDDRLLGEWDRLCDSLLSEFSKPGADRAAHPTRCMPHGAADYLFKDV